MTLDDWHLDPTRLLGLASFGLAATACLLAGWRRHASARAWRLLAGAQLLLFAEIALGMRHRVHALVDGVLRAHGLYESRNGLQIVLLVAVLLAFAALAVAAAGLRRHGTGTAMAAFGTFAAAALVMAEAVSLHRLDALMYARVGPFLAISWMWAACAAVVIVAARHRARA